MKTFGFCLAIVGCLLASGFAKVPSKSGEAVWSTFNSREGRFVVLMPSLPKEEVQSYSNWVTRRLYQLIGITTGKTLSPEVDKFLSSFKLEGDVPTPLTAWTEFTSESGGFKILMPAKPTEQTMPVPTVLGSVDAHVYMSVSKDGIAYLATYSDLPTPPKDEGELIKTLDGVRNGQLEKTKGKLLSEATMSLDGNLGRELKMDIPIGRSISRIFLVGKRLYQIVAVIPQAIVNSESVAQDTAKFLASFKLMPH